jgi:hypothetical protein
MVALFIARASRQGVPANLYQDVSIAATGPGPKLLCMGRREQVYHIAVTSGGARKLRDKEAAAATSGPTAFCDWDKEKPAAFNLDNLARLL